MSRVTFRPGSAPKHLVCGCLPFLSFFFFFFFGFLQTRSSSYFAFCRVTDRYSSPASGEGGHDRRRKKKEPELFLALALVCSFFSRLSLASERLVTLRPGDRRSSCSSPSSRSMSFPPRRLPVSGVTSASVLQCLGEHQPAFCPHSPAGQRQRKFCLRFSTLYFQSFLEVLRRSLRSCVLIYLGGGKPKKELNSSLEKMMESCVISCKV